MVQYPKYIQKGIAIDMRKKGFSYSEIRRHVTVPKATLSYWFRNIKLDESQIQKLNDKRRQVAQGNTQKRISKISDVIEEIKQSSMRDVKQISKRELWLMGIVLYWRERLLSSKSSGLRNGVRFTSSDPHLIKLFLKWLQDVGGFEGDDMHCDIFLGKDKKNSTKDVIAHWARVTSFPKEQFSHIYFQTTHRKKTKRVYIQKSQFGFLRIRVKASIMLARQIHGWVNGIREHYWGDA